MTKLIAFLTALFEWLSSFPKTKKPGEIEDEAHEEVADNTLDDDIDVISGGMRD